MKKKLFENEALWWFLYLLTISALTWYIGLNHILGAISKAVGKILN